jgi:hypothetical protein
LNTTVYSFLDYNIVISHPAVGQAVLSGEGVGEMTVSMATERTAHDVAADGAVMVSKIGGRNGTVTLSLQQTSYAHQWLKNWYKYLEGAPASAWAETTIIARSILAQDTITASYVSPQKIPDRSFQAAGQKVSWPLMAADIQQD